MDRSITYGGLDPTVGIFVEGIKETRNFIAYKVSDGSTAWGPSPSQTALDYFGNPIYPYIASQLAFGKLYSYAYGGILYCYDLKTGNLDWTYGNGGVAGNNTDSGFQAPGYYPGFIQAVGGHGLMTEYYTSLSQNTQSKHQSSKAHSHAQSTQLTEQNSGALMTTQASSAQ